MSTYNHVYIQGFGYVTPPNVVRTRTLEEKLAPVYQKLGMQIGQLEALTGLRERRFWDEGTRPSQKATEAVQKALMHGGITAGEVGLLINCSVCRDYLEPSTAALVAKNCKIPKNAILFDVSNACLGFATGLSVAANMIELGQVDTAVVVSSESASELVENTIHKLLAQPTTENFLQFIPSLTLGSSAVAWVLSSRKKQKTNLKFLGGATRNDNEQSHLCLWGPDTGFPASLSHIMRTDGKTLLETGTRLAIETWQDFLIKTKWNPGSFDTTFCHQVGIAHRNIIFDALKLDITKDFTTFETFGNTGSVAMPLTVCMGIEAGRFSAGQKAIMLGIGSGLVCTMYALEWGN